MYPTQRQIKKILRSINGEINSSTIIEGDWQLSDVNCQNRSDHVDRKLIRK